MNKKKLRILLIKLGLVCALVVGLFKLGNTLGNMNKVVYASNMNGYNISDTVKTKEVKVAENRAENDYDVLIYHSHTHEDYTNSNVVEMGEDLKTKLEAKGLKVKTINDDFTKNDYNNSYYASRKMLKDELQNNNYKLVIDLHRDSIVGTRKILGKDNNGKDVGKIMFVTTRQNPNYIENKKCIDEIKDYIDKFGKDLTRETYTYNKGITYYSSDLGNKNGDGNVILIENSFNTNEKLEIKRANTYLSSAIVSYFKNNIK